MTGGAVAHSAIGFRAVGEDEVQGVEFCGRHAIVALCTGVLGVTGGAVRLACRGGSSMVGDESDSVKRLSGPVLAQTESADLGVTEAAISHLMLGVGRVTSQAGLRLRVGHGGKILFAPREVTGAAVEAMGSMRKGQAGSPGFWSLPFDNRSSGPVVTG
ncbi:MAG: hypothetical protein HKO65_18800 [Gemmatimonadetes bacterium]|nr:hypothetical protein [Gemmatimonadota bacterium]NNM07149.1 hypothetical protein [Gemmatimonadota bacterium]